MSSKGVAMDKRTKKPVGPQVANYPIQNLATAEIIPIAIIALYKRCKELELDVQFINTVHDSVICLVKDDELTPRLFRRSAELAFTTDVYDRLKYMYGIDFNVPLGMEMVIGKHWGKGKEYKYDDVNNRRQE
jgi:DNA polymerase I-like protein with 3'-5' exonuclease and polymerase domains